MRECKFHDSSLTRITHGSSENRAKGQAFRPQSMGLWFQHPPPQPWVLIPKVPGLAAPVRLYACDLQACPFAPKLSCSSVKQVFMRIRGKPLTPCRPRGETKTAKSRALSAESKSANASERLPAPCPMRQRTGPLPRSGGLASRSFSRVNNPSQYCVFEVCCRINRHLNV